MLIFLSGAYYHNTQALGTLGSRLGGTSHRDHSNELESPEVAAVAAAGANMSWKQPHITPHGDGSGDDDGSMGGGRVSEEEPLLREEVRYLRTPTTKCTHESELREE